jgi:hypothetical protein
MAKRVFHATAYTPTATADATAHASGTYQALKGGSSTQLINIMEAYIAGMAGASSPTYMQLARVGTLENAPTALAAPNSDGPMHPSTAALAAPPVSFTAAGTGPQRSNATTDGRLELGLNAFGGIIRWVAAPGEEFGQLGNTTTLGESILSAFTGGTPGLVNSHLVYEPF